MKKYLFNEVCGKVQGKTIVVSAENFPGAIEELSKNYQCTEIIPYYEKFKKFYATRIYSVDTEKGEMIVHLEKN